MDVTYVIPAMNADTKPAKLPSVVLFDLDGTLVDPAGGITGGLQYALAAFDLPVPSLEVLNSVIGPKLADALVNLLGVPVDKVDDVIAAYRGWYTAQGMAMSVVYPGIDGLLAQLKDDGVLLAVATQKPEPLAKVLLAHHGLAGYFHSIRGSHSDESLKPGDPGYRSGKTEIIAAALADTSAMAAPDAEPGSPFEPVSPFEAVMVGDRHQDVHGATSNGLACIGVGWGFAADGEVAAAGVSAVVHSTQELIAVLSGEGNHGAV